MIVVDPRTMIAWFTAEVGQLHRSWPTSGGLMRSPSTLSDDRHNLYRSQGLRLTQGVSHVLGFDHTLDLELNPEPLSGAARLRGSGSRGSCLWRRNR
jgi:hypothetical protein